MTAGPPALDSLLAHADWLHRLGQQLCRDQHAAADAAQDALLSAVRTPPAHGANVRGYLARALRNLLGLQRRTRQRSTARELRHAATASTFAESAATLAERAELHQFLGRCVLELPEPQRALVLLHYFEGTPLAAVASRTQLTTDAVRGHLRRARDTLRARLTDAGEHPRAAQAFAAVLATFATTHATALLMTTPGKLVAAAAAAAVCLFWWAPWSVDDAAAGAAGPGGAPLARAELPRPASPIADAAKEPADAAANPRIAVVPTGSLHVRVLWSDGTPGSDLGLRVQPDLDEIWREREVRTDAAGEATVHELPCDQGQVLVDWRRGAPFTIAAGKTTDVVVQMQPGVTVRGLVVDENGAPMATARVWLSRLGGGDEGCDVGPVASDGTFVLRDTSEGAFVAAFAPGRRASTLTAIAGAAGTTQDVRIELRDPGVSLLGHVQHADGRAAAGTRVFVGLAENKAWWRESVWRESRPPLGTRCDEHGDFRIDGLAPGSVERVWLRGDDTAPCKHLVPLPESGTLTRQFVVTAGARVHGRATDAEGRPLADVYVSGRSRALEEAKERDRFEAIPPFLTVFAKTDARGEYELRHVSVGTVPLVAKRFANQEAHRTAELTVELHDDQTLRWDPVLTSGAVIRGVVVDDGDTPLVGWDVYATGESPGHSQSVTTDARGCFELTDCGDDDYQLLVYAPDSSRKFAVALRRGVAAGTEALRIVIPGAAIPSATLTGTVQLADGEPAKQAMIWLWHEGARFVEAIPEHFDGTFRIGVLAPGTWRACAECGGRRTAWTERFPLRAGETLDIGTLRFGPVGSVEITVCDAAGARLDGIDCHVMDAIEGNDLVVAAGRANGGTLRLADLRPGDYRVRTMHKDQPRLDVPFAIRADEGTALAVAIPASVPCVLVTQPSQRGGYQHFAFRWTRNGGPMQHDHEQISTRGEKRIARRLLPGDYTLTITDDLGVSSENHFTIAATDAAGREVPIRLP